MTDCPEGKGEVIRAIQQGMENAWDLLALDDRDPRDSSGALAHAALASMEAAGFYVVTREEKKDYKRNELVSSDQ